MVGLEGDDDAIEVGSDFPYAKEIKEVAGPKGPRKKATRTGKCDGQSTNSTSMDFKNKGELSKIVKFNEVELSKIES